MQLPLVPSFTTPSNTPSYSSSVEQTVNHKNQQTLKRMGLTPPPTQTQIKANLHRQRTASYQKQAQKAIKAQQVYLLISQKSQFTSAASSSKNEYNGLFRFADLQSSEYQKAAPYYWKALSELTKMLTNKTAVDLKKGVYLVENALLRDAISYPEFTSKINQLKGLLNQIAEQENINLSNDIAAHYAIQKLYTDTLVDKTTKLKFYPIKYDMEDFFGQQDYSKTFVSKLLFSGSGQCKSMPLLYSILANELDAESYLSFSPSHSYIKFKDQQGTWYNYETTNGMITSDSWVIGSGVVKAEAIKTKTFTEPISNTELLAHLLVELAISYEQEFGYHHDFMEKAIDQALAIFPNDVYGLMVKANMKTAEFDRSLWQANYPKLNELSKYPTQQKLFSQMIGLYDQVEETGYSKMPEEAYQEWLKTLEQQKQQRASQELKLDLQLKAIQQ